MREIKRLVDDMRHNIEEAREKIKKAYHLHDDHRMEADWQRDMAAAHMAFNGKGHEIVTRRIAEIKEAYAPDPMMPGMLAVYKEMHAEIMADAAEVKAMIDAYK